MMGYEEAEGRETNGETADNGRPAVLLAAAPHLLYAALTILGELGIGVGAGWTGYLLLAGLGGMMLLAWRRHWPLWSASWAGYALIIILFISSFALNPLLGRAEILLFLPLIVLGLYLFQARLLYALIASLPFIVLNGRALAFELVAGGTWIFTGLWLLAAVISGAVVQARSARSAILFTLGFHLVSGAAIALGRGYLPYRWPEMGARVGPTWQELVNDFVPVTLSLIVLTLALLLLHPLKRVAMVHNGRGWLGLTVLIAGIAATFGGRVGLDMQGFDPGAATVIWVVVLVLGLAISLGAGVFLARLTWRKNGGPVRALLAPFLAPFAPLVVFSLATPFAPVGSYSAGFQRVLILSYAGVLLWACLALWVMLQADSNRRFPTQPAAASADNREDSLVRT